MGKRLLDLTAAILGLIVLLPVFAATAATIRLTSPGPAVFAQVRLGRYGRPFRMYKFRSMVADADRRGSRLTAGGDPRVTRLGHWLRRIKLDELPQLWNVLRGDMSLVGPRPEVPEFAHQFPEQYGRLLKVRPGITHRVTLAFRTEEAILAEPRVAEPMRFYLDRVMPRKLAMYEANLEDPLLRDVWTILETVSPWKSTRGLTAGELLDAPVVANVPAWPEPATALRPRAQSAQMVASEGGVVMARAPRERPADTTDEIEEAIRIVQTAG